MFMYADSRQHHVHHSFPTRRSSDLEAQLDMIRDLNLEVVPLLPATRQALAGEDDCNRVAITFDDAYESVYQNAAPLLERHGLPYTIFVNTDAIGSRGYMSWEQLQELATGEQVTIEIGRASCRERV